MISKIKNRLDEYCSILTFTYRGVDCDIDPFNPNKFHVRYGDTEMDYDSIEKVLYEPIYDGRSLSDIADKIQEIEW